MAWWILLGYLDKAMREGPDLKRRCRDVLAQTARLREGGPADGASPLPGQFTRLCTALIRQRPAKEIVAGFSRWHVHVPAADDVLGAIGIHQRTGISFWDAMIVRSAAEMGCTALYSEDLNPGQEYSGVRAQNPFQPPAAGRA